MGVTRRHLHQFGSERMTVDVWATDERDQSVSYETVVTGPQPYEGDPEFQFSLTGDEAINLAAILLTADTLIRRAREKQRDSYTLG